MAWVCVDMDDTLLESFEEGQSQPVEGAIEAMQMLAAEGHRLTVFTARFAPMPESERQRLKEEFEAELATWGFPPMEVWTGTSKPDWDVYIDNKAVTFDKDWGLCLAQVGAMLEDKGLSPAQQMQAQEEGGGEPPPEGEAGP